jgi:hypothetical protein
MDRNFIPEDYVIWVCQGPPACLLQDTEAILEQRKGCSMCKRIIIFEDGSEQVIQPSEP